MRVLMRADCNANIGQGHVMRLLSVADAFTAMGVLSAFVIAKDTSANRMKDRGYEVFALSSSYTEMDSEVEELTGIIQSYGADLLLVDSYYVTKEYLNAMCEKIFTGYLDDVYDFAYPVDLLINYNVYANGSKYKELYETEGMKLPSMIIGPSYAPLRAEFAGIPKREQNREVRKVALSFGGADPMRMAKKFVETLIEYERLNSDNTGCNSNNKKNSADTDKSITENCEIHMILGAMEPDLEALKEMELQYSWLKLHVNIPNMKEVLQQMDIIVSAAGSTQYEICACQIPCICFSMADNQMPGGEEFGRLGIFHYAGDVRFNKSLYTDMIEEILKLKVDYERRVLMGEKEKELVDGNGAKRMAEQIIKYSGGSINE